MGVFCTRALGRFMSFCAHTSMYEQRSSSLTTRCPGPPCRRIYNSGRGRRAAGCACRAVWDESMTLADLRAQLDAALAVEDYKQAARLRDAIA
eukprot:349608-Chlamydomonas_euryale.AAC.10